MDGGYIRHMIFPRHWMYTTPTCPRRPIHLAVRCMNSYCTLFTRNTYIWRNLLWGKIVVEKEKKNCNPGEGSLRTVHSGYTCSVDEIPSDLSTVCVAGESWAALTPGELKTKVCKVSSLCQPESALVTGVRRLITWPPNQILLVGNAHAERMEPLQVPVMANIKSGAAPTGHPQPRRHPNYIYQPPPARHGVQQPPRRRRRLQQQQPVS